MGTPRLAQSFMSARQSSQRQDSILGVCDPNIPAKNIAGKLA
jgi:hypothetical protein